MKKPKVGIVGAGPGGLVAARILSINGIDVTVLEREESFTKRTQGGSLDIHADAGQIALAKAGLMEEFAKLARYADQESRIYDKHSVLRHIDTDVTDKTRPEIDRGQLRKMLLDSLPEGVVRWDAQVVGAKQGAVRFANGKEEGFELIVGADGTWSKIRPLLSPVVPKYTGILTIEFGIDRVEERYPDTAAMVGRGLTFALGDSKAIAAHSDANDHFGGYLMLRKPENWTWTEREELCEEFEGWSENLLLWIRRSEVPLTPRPIYELPAGHSWPHCEGITLLGDAAHVITPFGGDGANLAMLDGADLAEAVLQPDWREAVKHFEIKMQERATKPARDAGQLIQDVLSPQGLEVMVSMFGSHV